MKKFLSNALLFIAFVTPFTSCNNDPSPSDRYVIALSLDGFRQDYISRGNTPTFDSLERVGVKGGFRPCFPSVTFPNHYSMATGLHPDHHGLINNLFYANDLDKEYSISDREAVENPDFYGGEPIWNTAERQGVKAASFFWVGSETAIQGRQPSIWKKFDDSVPWKNRADSVISWLQLPEERRPHLIMWYIEEPDGIGHTATPDSSSVINVVDSLDTIVNYFFTKARKLDIYDKIDFLVVSDHGMATYTADKYINLYDYMPIDSFDYIFYGVPTLLYPKPTYTETAYNIIKEIPHVSVYKRDELPEKFVYGTNDRLGDLVVVPDVGAYVSFSPRAVPRTGGAHGYDNFAPEMEAIFYAAGPSFKNGYRAETIANVNLYTLIAKLLGIEPAPNDGDLEAVSKMLKEQ